MLPNQHIAPQTVPSLAWERRIPASRTLIQIMLTLMLKASLAVTTVMGKYSQPSAYVKRCIRLKVNLHFRHDCKNCEKQLLILSCLSPRLSKWNNSAPTKIDFHEILYLSIFLKCIEKIHVS